jgi:uncharacterized membrane protein YedE/YeeE
MISTLLRLIGFDLKRLAQDAAITVVLAMFGAFAAILALALGIVAIYLWFEVKFGIFTALSIVGGASALLGIVLFALAFRRAPRKPRDRSEDALRATADPVQAPASIITRAANEAMQGAAEIVRNGSPQQIAGTIAVAVLIGWILGRRS